jgi:branched-chain amino acid transport system substrate-binding protein
MRRNPTIAKRAAVSGALIVAAAALAGCASGSGIQAGERVDVYVSMPLHGAQAANGHDVVDGARLALADSHGEAGDLSVRATYLDDSSGHGARAKWSPAVAAANARTATQDSAAIAFIGDFDSGATRFSLPITNEARLLQVSPAASAVDLVQPYLGAGDQVPEEVQPTGERTFGRVIPSDETQAQAGAAWAKRLGSHGVTVIRGESDYDKVIADAFAEHARAIGIRLTKTGPSDLGYAAVEPPEGGRLAVVRAIPRVLGTDALLTPSVPDMLVNRRLPRQLFLTSAAEDPSQLPASGQRFVRDFRKRYHRDPGRYAAYGYETMAVILDSIVRAGDSGDDRDAVVDAFFDTTDRRSILGMYSIDDVGNTTLNSLAGYRIVNGMPRFETPLQTGE